MSYREIFSSSSSSPSFSFSDSIWCFLSLSFQKRNFLILGGIAQHLTVGEVEQNTNDSTTIPFPLPLFHLSLSSLSSLSFSVSPLSPHHFWVFSLDGQAKLIDLSIVLQHHKKQTASMGNGHEDFPKESSASSPSSVPFLSLGDIPNAVTFSISNDILSLGGGLWTHSHHPNKMIMAAGTHKGHIAIIEYQNSNSHPNQQTNPNRNGNEVENPKENEENKFPNESHDPPILSLTLTSTLIPCSPHGILTSVVQFSPSGHLLVSGHSDGQINIIDFLSKRTRDTFHSHHQTVRATCWTQDDKMLFSAGDEGEIHQHDISNATLIRKIQAHSGFIYGLDMAYTKNYNNNNGEGADADADGDVSMSSSSCPPPSPSPPLLISIGFDRRVKVFSLQNSLISSSSSILECVHSFHHKQYAPFTAMGKLNFNATDPQKHGEEKGKDKENDNEISSHLFCVGEENGNWRILSLQNK